MADPIRAADSASRAAPRAPRRALARIFANASLLVFASLAVMTLVSGRLAAALLWAGALMVFFVHALELRQGALDRAAGARAPWIEAVRWAGLACALSGAAVLWS
jgi:hypothetical protein